MQAGTVPKGRVYLSIPHNGGLEEDMRGMNLKLEGKEDTTIVTKGKMMLERIKGLSIKEQSFPNSLIPGWEENTNIPIVNTKEDNEFWFKNTNNTYNCFH